jgi:hypothetical protein
MTERGWKDFSEMPDDKLRALANDIANATEAMKRIRARKKAVRADGERAPDNQRER